MAEINPFALALIVADGIHVDPGTGKFTILGTFSTIHARKFPAQHGVMSVYFALTDGRGKCTITIKVVDTDDSETIAETSNDVVFDDPRSVIEGVLQIEHVTFPDEGEYRLQLISRDELLLERRILLRTTKR